MPKAPVCQKTTTNQPAKTTKVGQSANLKLMIYAYRPQQRVELKTFSHKHKMRDPLIASMKGDNINCIKNFVIIILYVN